MFRARVHRTERYRRHLATWRRLEGHSSEFAKAIYSRNTSTLLTDIGTGCRLHLVWTFRYPASVHRCDFRPCVHCGLRVVCSHATALGTPLRDVRSY